jgi:hypothetical protein
MHQDACLYFLWVSTCVNSQAINSYLAYAIQGPEGWPTWPGRPRGDRVKLITAQRQKKANSTSECVFTDDSDTEMLDEMIQILKCWTIQILIYWTGNVAQTHLVSHSVILLIKYYIILYCYINIRD